MVTVLPLVGWLLAAPLPPWATQLELAGDNPQTITIQGDGAPQGIVLVKGAGGITLKAKGPGRLQLEIYLLTLRRGPKSPVTINLLLPTGATSRVHLPGTPQDWKLQGEPLFALARPLTTTVRIGPGEEVIKLEPGEKRILGLALRAKMLPPNDDAEPPLAALPAAEPPLPEGPIDEPPLPEPPALTTTTPEPVPDGQAKASPAIDPPEPDLEVPTTGKSGRLWDASGSRSQAPSTAVTQATPMPKADAPTAPSGPALPTAPGQHPLVAPDEDVPEGAGFRPTGIYPSLVIESVHGRDTFLWIRGESGLELEAFGPGVLLLDVHAHRDAELASTLEPVSVAVLIDDVLVERAALADTPSPTYKAKGQRFELGTRTEIAIPIPVGTHDVQLTLPASAARGVSVRPRFDPDGDLDKPAIAVEQPPAAVVHREAPAAAAASPWRAEGGLLAGVWLPVALPSPGAAVTASARVAFPFEAVDLAAGLQVSFLYASYDQGYEDPRVGGGQDAVSVSWVQLPILIDLRYRASLPWDLGLTVSAGVGPMLSLGARSVGAASEPWATEVGGAASAAVGLEIPVGPGAVDVQAQMLMQLSPSFALGGLSNLNGTGGLIVVGYRLGGALFAH